MVAANIVWLGDLVWGAVLSIVLDRSVKIAASVLFIIYLLLFIINHLWQKVVASITLEV